VAERFDKLVARTYADGADASREARVPFAESVIATEHANREVK